MLPHAKEMRAGRQARSMMGEREPRPEEVVSAVLFLGCPLSDLVQEKH